MAITSAILCCAITGTAQADATSAAPATPDAGVVTHVGEDAAEPSPWIALCDATTADMLDPAFWSNDDTVRLTPEQIAEINDANPARVSFLDAQGGVKYVYTYECPETLPGEDVRRLLLDWPLPAEGSALYCNGRELAYTYWEGLEKRMDLEGVPDEVAVRYAVCTERTIAYGFPTDDFITSDPDDPYYSATLAAEVMTGTGVVIIHQTTDGTWSYCLCGFFAGWVRTDCLAVCSSYDEWRDALNPQEFLVVTGNNVLLDVTADPTATSGMVLPMGTKLRLAPDAPLMVGGRAVYNAYAAEMPVRDADGMLAWETVVVPVSRDVNVGYLEYSSAALVEQAFKFNGQVYGWGGSFESNDCSGMLRQVYACFGIELPRNSSKIAIAGGLLMGQFGVCSIETKTAIIESCMPGTLLEFPGHITMYLGEVGGKHYVISSVGSMMVRDGKELAFQPMNCVCVTSMEDTFRRSGLNWLECMTHWVTI